MFTKILTKLGFTKEETSWILYDVGNSAQVLTTCTVIFPLLIAKITPGDSSVCRLGKCNLCDYSGRDISCAWNDGGLQG